MSLRTVVNFTIAVSTDFTGLYERILGRAYTDAERDARDGRNGSMLHPKEDPRDTARFFATPPRAPFCLRAVCRRAS